MIVRILGEGQLEVADDVLDHLNTLDDAVETAVEAEDDAAFRSALTTLLDAVREHGQPLPDDALLPSDAILPASDIPLAEIRQLLGDEGLIPG
jgi:hypothetical protein